MIASNGGPRASVKRKYVEDKPEVVEDVVLTKKATSPLPPPLTSNSGVDMRLFPAIVRVAFAEDTYRPANVESLRGDPRYRALRAPASAPAKHSGEAKVERISSAAAATTTSVAAPATATTTSVAAPAAASNSNKGGGVGSGLGTQMEAALPGIRVNGAMRFGTTFAVELRGFTVDSLRTVLFGDKVRAAQAKAMYDVLQGLDGKNKRAPPPEEEAKTDMMWDADSPAPSFLTFVQDCDSMWVPCGRTLDITTAILSDIRLRTDDRESAEILGRLLPAINTLKGKYDFQVHIAHDDDDGSGGHGRLRVAERPVAVLLETTFVESDGKPFPHTHLLLPLMHDLLPRSEVDKWHKQHATDPRVSTTVSARLGRDDLAQRRSSRPSATAFVST